MTSEAQVRELKDLNVKLTRACIASHEVLKMLTACCDIPAGSDEHRAMGLLENALIEASRYRKKALKPTRELKLVGAEEVKD